MALSFIVLLMLKCGVVKAESLEARLTVLSVSPARIRVEGERSLPTKTWSFLNYYAGIAGLGERIENLKLMDRNHAPIAVRKLAPGEYVAENAASRFSYEVKLEAPLEISDSAYISWIGSERGLFMPADLLPQLANEGSSTTDKVKLKIDLPAGWKIASSQEPVAEGAFQLADASRAVFFVGRDLRERRARVNAIELKLVTSDQWAFSDTEAVSVASAILKEHAGTLGDKTRRSATIILTQFPRAVSSDRWSAETRGEAVVLLLGAAPTKMTGLSQLNFILGHELFHLWIPNSLALDGSYDWFYEGFTSYQSLRAAVKLQHIAFQDYLNALARAYDAYLSARERDSLSLIEASRRRWTSDSQIVYRKAMLVAFLYDLKLRQRTKSERSLDDAYKYLFRHHAAGKDRVEGNRAVLTSLNSPQDMRDFTGHFIESASAIDLAQEVTPFGLRVEHFGSSHRLRVADSLNKEQRALLRKLGYNN